MEAAVAEEALISLQEDLYNQALEEIQPAAIFSKEKDLKNQEEVPEKLLFKVDLNKLE